MIFSQLLTSRWFLTAAPTISLSYFTTGSAGRIAESSISNMATLVPVVTPSRVRSVGQSKWEEPRLGLHIPTVVSSRRDEHTSESVRTPTQQSTRPHCHVRSAGPAGRIPEPSVEPMATAVPVVTPSCVYSVEQSPWTKPRLGLHIPSVVVLPRDELADESARKRRYPTLPRGTTAGRPFPRHGDWFQSFVPLPVALGPVFRAYLLPPIVSDQSSRLPGHVHPGPLLGPVFGVEHSERLVSVLIPAVATEDRRSGRRLAPPCMLSRVWVNIWISVSSSAGCHAVSPTKFATFSHHDYHCDEVKGYLSGPM